MVKEVSVTRYEADDGSIWDTISEAVVRNQTIVQEKDPWYQFTKSWADRGLINKKHQLGVWKFTWTDSDGYTTGKSIYISGILHSALTHAITKYGWSMIYGRVEEYVPPKIIKLR